MEVGTPDVIVAQHYTWKGMCGARESARGLGSPLDSHVRICRISRTSGQCALPPVVAFVDNKLTLPVYRHPVDKAARTGALIHSA